MSHFVTTTLLAGLGLFAGACGDASDATEASRVDSAVETIAASCASCHEEQVRFWRYGAHATVTCTTCHDVEGDHVLTGAKLERPTIESCFGCHAFGPEAGAGQPSEAEMLEHHLRVVEQKHVINVDRGKVGNRCVSCHDPHSTQ